MTMMHGSSRASIFRFSLFSTFALCSGVMARMISGGTILLGCWPAPLTLLLDAFCDAGSDACSASFSLSSAIAPLLDSVLTWVAACGQEQRLMGGWEMAPQTWSSRENGGTSMASQRAY